MGILRNLIESKEVLIAPGVYDVVTAALVQRAGFQCAYMTGSGVSISSTGFPDIGLISFAEVLERLGHITENLSIPLIADGDTGFGGTLNVVRTTREFERRGAAAIQIEDQVMPKKCGHELDRRCISAFEMKQKIAAACDTRSSEEFLVVARTDARTNEGLQAAIERAYEYQEAGADILFVESLESIEEIEAARKALSAPVMANMVEGGRTPLLDREQLESLGYNVAIFPNTILRVVCAQVSAALEHLSRTGGTHSILDQMWLHREVWDLFKHEEWVALEHKYAKH